ncbi:extracellular solute-binding protein [Paenibacillus sp. MER 99-2]|uniref:ABC transporter substrate-binding protein n=1 Tax=Paenibacillus sp. MER 99-2 TaxID=2939572 RepID=UPI00203AFA68|nr:extracellular solute-binding protein [Paenibacillus sp. MER 99-2]MCM3173073.1 extracellular solute-binding protein [Paenibacillus sp. MER 99-2]
MIRKRSFFPILLLVFMLFVSACSGGGTAQTASEQEGTTNSGNTTETVEASTEVEEPAADVPNLNGRVIKVAAWWDLKPAGETASDKARLDKIAEVEKKYNVTIEFVNVPFEEYMNKFTTTALAGEPFADIVQMEYKSALPAVLKGQLLPISEFTTSENNINQEANLMTRFPSIAGNDYAFDSPTSIGLGLHYNRDLFKKLSLPDPQELYNNGEWTWDKFMELAKQATKDTDNDGKIDVYGYSGWVIDALRHFTAANGGTIVDDGNSKEGLSDPKTIEAAEFIKRLYNVENVVKVKTGDKTNWEESNTFKDGDVALFTAAEWQLGDLTFAAGVVPIPNGPQGDKSVTYANNAAAAKFIPKGVEDPKIVYQIYEETFDIPQIEEYPGQDYLESLYSDEKDIAMIREHIAGTGRILLDDAYAGYPIGDYVNDIIKNNASVTATAEKYKAQAQAAVDKLSKQ